MKLAERFRLPLITLIDTPGAYPGVGSEERGQSEAIARNLFEMSALAVPIISAVIGEGGSGGALAIGVCDRLLMLQYSIYSVISPEGCASILWKSADKKELAAEAMGLTADRLSKLDLVDEVIREPLGGAHRDPTAMTELPARRWRDICANWKRCPSRRCCRHGLPGCRLSGFFQAPEIRRTPALFAFGRRGETDAPGISMTSGFNVSHLAASLAALVPDGSSLLHRLQRWCRFDRPAARDGSAARAICAARRAGSARQSSSAAAL
jgi:hypothetical protein